MYIKVSYYFFLVKYYGIGGAIRLLWLKITEREPLFRRKHQVFYNIFHNKELTLQSKRNFAIVNYQDERFFLRKHTSDLMIFQQVYIDKGYQEVVSIFNDNFGNDGDANVIDLGANIGITCRFFYSHLKPSRIIAVEPDCSNFKMLIENTKFSPNFCLENLAIWSSDTMLSIDNSFRDKESWSVRVLEGHHKNDVRAITLKTLLNKYKIDIIDILKIDIEGSEKELFLNDPTFLSIILRVKVIAIEVHEEVIAEAEINSILTKFSFKISKKNELIIGINTKI